MLAEESRIPPWDIIPEDETDLADRRVLRILLIVLGTAIVIGILVLLVLALHFPGRWTTSAARARLARLIAGLVLGFAVVLAVCLVFQLLKGTLAESMERKCGEAAVFFVAREGKRHMRGRGVVLVAREGLEMRGRIDAPGAQALAMGGGGGIVGAIAQFLGREPFLVTIAAAAGAVISYLVWRHSTSLFVPREDVECISCSGPYVTLKFLRPPAKHLEYVSFYVNRALRREFFAALAAVFPGMLPRAYREALAVAR